MADADDDIQQHAVPMKALHRVVRSAWARRIGLIVGAALLILAIVTVLRQHAAVSDAWRSIQQRSPAQLAWQLTVVVASIVGNLALTAAMFSLLMSRHGKVGVAEMQALIAAATLMNYVPLRPGLFGRVAYHKSFNNIPIASSLAVVVQGIAISVLASVYLAAAVMAHRLWGVHLAVVAITPLPLLMLCGATWRAPRIWCWAGAIRFAEVFIIAIRYFIVFHLVGAPIGISGSIAVACISMMTTMVPFLSNGLGLREWAVGIAAPLLTSYQMEFGLTADLVIRAVEMLVIAVAGCAGLAWLSRFQMRHRPVS